MRKHVKIKIVKLELEYWPHRLSVPTTQYSVQTAV